MQEQDHYFKIAHNLSKCEKVNSYDQGSEKEAWTLAHAFTDLNESFTEFSKRLFPQLINENLTGEEIEILLQEIGDELRHIIYHIKDPQYYKHLFQFEEPS